MRSVSLLLLGTFSAALAATPQITAVTPTQAVLSYTAPGTGACTLEVSESPTLTPLVHDVDPVLFRGADRDDRAGNIVSGTNRVFVVGRRAAQRAADGRMYSRALQANTAHYYRLRCGTQVWTSSFRTANLAPGNTAPDPYPVDPERPGEYAWPNMNFGAGTNEKHVDPQTGILINRLTGPKSYLHGDYLGVPPQAVINRGGGNNPWRFQNGVAGAAYTADGSSPAMLYVALDNSGLDTAFPPVEGGEIVQLDWVTVTVSGSASGGGADSRLVGCLTNDGVNCISGSALAEVDLRSCGSGCTLGDTRSTLAAWSMGPVPPFSGADLGLRQTTAGYDRASGRLTWQSGSLFNTDLVAGSNVWIDSTAYRVAAGGDAKTITIAAGLNLTSPVTVVSSSFGVLLWKKTPTSGTSVTLSQVAFNLGAPYAFSFWNQSSMNHCHPETVTYAGQEGYHCVLLGGSGAVLAWINRSTGDANLLGRIAVSRKDDSSGNGWGGAMVPFSGALFDGDDPNVMYGVITDQNKKQIVVRMTYSGDNSPASGGVDSKDMPWSEVRNLTPAKPGGYDLESLIQRFDARYDPSQYTCKGHSMQAGKLAITCSPGQDRTPGGWVVVFDPKIPAGTATNPVIAAMPTNGAKSPAPTPMRWCVLHSMSSGDPGWLLVGANPAASGSHFSTTLARPFSTGDTHVYVSGEPGGGSPDIARVGDYFKIDSEIVRISARSGSTDWTVDRGQAGTSIAAHASGATALARCTASTVKSESTWWNYQADPHGANLSGRTVDTDTPYFMSGHGVFGLGIFTLFDNGADCTRNAGGPVCLVSRTGPVSTSIHQPPQTYVNVYPPFAGVTSGMYALQSHASRAQMTASDFEKQWVLDSNPILDGYFLKTSVTKVAGTAQLYVAAKALNSKQVPAYASCGSHPLLDVSGPGSVIGDGAVDAYKYCVPNAAGECRAGSARGQIYLNCPGLTYLGCGRDQYDSSGQNAEDVCIFDGTVAAGAQVMQIGTATTERTGASMRRITHGFARYRRQEEEYNANGKALPGGEWALFLGRWIDGQRSDIYAAKLPPYQLPDGVDRSTFVPLRVNVPAAPAGAADAVVEFGYNPEYRCASRRDSCIAVSAGVNPATPFYWASEKYAGAACSGGCTIAIPAISQRVVYYRVKYRKADGSVLSTGTTGVLVSP